MSVILNPYIPFNGTARAAMEFYKSVFGGELTLTSYGDMPGMDAAPGQENLVMHGMLITDDGLCLMGADMDGAPPFNGSISLSGDDDPTLRGYYDKLAEGGTIGEPLAQAPWGDTFGMVTDKFGVNWMVNIAGLAG